MTRREDHSVSPPVIRIKPKAFSVVDTADSLTARQIHGRSDGATREAPSMQLKEICVNSQLGVRS